jgi:hypothetical protein
MTPSMQGASGGEDGRRIDERREPCMRLVSGPRMLSPRPISASGRAVVQRERGPGGRDGHRQE